MMSDYQSGGWGHTNQVERNSAYSAILSISNHVEDKFFMWLSEMQVIHLPVKLISACVIWFAQQKAYQLAEDPSWIPRNVSVTSVAVSSSKTHDPALRTNVQLLEDNLKEVAWAQQTSCETVPFLRLLL